MCMCMCTCTSMCTCMCMFDVHGHAHLLQPWRIDSDEDASRVLVGCPSHPLEARDRLARHHQRLERLGEAPRPRCSPPRHHAAAAAAAADVDAAQPVARPPEGMVGQVAAVRAPELIDGIEAGREAVGEETLVLGVHRPRLVNGWGVKGEVCEGSGVRRALSSAYIARARARVAPRARGQGWLGRRPAHAPVPSPRPAANAHPPTLIRQRSSANTHHPTLITQRSSTSPRLGVHAYPARARAL